MTRFHERTLSLLGDEGIRQQRSVENLLKFAAEKDFTVPASFLEWAALDDGSLLHKYSNTDWFSFDAPALITTPDGTRGLCFNTESQGNFSLLACLDQGDDPPVLFGWLGDSPWVRYAERFSDAVFAQLFDWQYRLEFPDGGSCGEIGYYGELHFDDDRCLVELRDQFEEVVATHYVADGRSYADYRFMKSQTLRLTVLASDDRSTYIMVMGTPEQSVREFEKELTDLLQL